MYVWIHFDIYIYIYPVFKPKKRLFLSQTHPGMESSWSEVCSRINCLLGIEIHGAGVPFPRWFIRKWRELPGTPGRGGGSLVTASSGRLWPQVLVACDRRNCYSVTFRGRRNIWSCWSFTSCGKRIIIWWCWSVTFVGRRSIGWNLGRQPEHNVWWGVVLE